MRVESSDSGTITSGIRHLLRVQKPTIKILIYTDDPDGITNDDMFFGVESMRLRLQAHKPAYADFRVRFASRNSSVANHADNKINMVLQREVDDTGQPFDEIWFFGMHQITTKGFSGGPLGGGPQSELDATEVAALEHWMNTTTDVGGGVLIAGDHSAKRPDDSVIVPQPACRDNANKKEPLVLGRAIGRCVPRAGLMRKWSGEPSSDPIDSTNTVVAGGFQQDRWPQSFVPLPLDENGNLNSEGVPHPLFFYRGNTIINVLPDHQHEGALIEVFDAKAWPSIPGKPQPLPQVIAKGINQRNATLFNLLSAYDGDPVDVGRIVADSSWHHYLNVNLLNLPHPADVDTDSDKIGQFYGNLGLWLAPRAKRTTMAHALLWEMANFTLVMGGPDDGISQIGKLAYPPVLQKALPCELHELIKVIVIENAETTFFDSNSLRQPQLVEVLFGGILNSYHQEINRSRQSADDYEPMTRNEVIRRGLNSAAESLT